MSTLFLHSNCALDLQATGSRSEYVIFNSFSVQGPKPPHLYALTNTMYQNMMMEHENQCVIIRYY